MHACQGGTCRVSLLPILCRSAIPCAHGREVGHVDSVLMGGQHAVVTLSASPNGLLQMSSKARDLLHRETEASKCTVVCGLFKRY